MLKIPRTMPRSCQALSFTRGAGVGGLASCYFPTREPFSRITNVPPDRHCQGRNADQQTPGTKGLGALGP